MALVRYFIKFYEGLIIVGNFLQPFLLLAIRLYWGWAFHLAGCQKFEAIEKTATFFNSLGIPFSELNAYLVATVECVGGWCLIFGFAARFVSIPLAATMVVALATAHVEGAQQLIENPSKFVIELPVTYLFTTLVVFVFGPGKISLDAIMRPVVNKIGVNK